MRITLVGTYLSIYFLSYRFRGIGPEFGGPDPIPAGIGYIYTRGPTTMVLISFYFLAIIYILPSGYHHPDACSAALHQYTPLLSKFQHLHRLQPLPFTQPSRISPLPPKLLPVSTVSSGQFLPFIQPSQPDRKSVV